MYKNSLKSWEVVADVHWGLDHLYDTVEKNKLPYIPWLLIVQWAQDRVAEITSADTDYWLSEPDYDCEKQELEIYNQNPEGEYLNTIGNMAYSSYGSHRALPFYQDSKESFTVKKLPVPWWSLYNIWFSHAELWNHQKAIEFYTQTLDDTHCPPEKKWRLLDNLWDSHAELWNHQESIEFYIQSLDDTYRPPEKKWRVLYDIWISYANLWNHQQAIKFYTQVLKDIHCPPDEKWRAFYRIGFSHNQLWNHQEAIKFYTQVLKDTHCPPEDKWKALNQLWFSHNQLWNHQKAIEFYNQALSNSHISEAQMKLIYGDLSCLYAILSI